MPESREVGVAYRGCRLQDPSQRAKQYAALKELLDAHSNDVRDWEMAPEIREHHDCEGVAKVGVLDFGRNYCAEPMECSWGAVGRLHDGSKATREHALTDVVRLTPSE